YGFEIAQRFLRVCDHGLCILRHGASAQKRETVRHTSNSFEHNSLLIQPGCPANPTYCIPTRSAVRCALAENASTSFASPGRSRRPAPRFRGLIHLVTTGVFAGAF